ncbi:hypothetical protein [Jejuia pallidilutea]|uniref:hypothetical protein n=1 Tax=Jejuia pallidilutea TaxID=504487 RepID=UPI00187C6E03|nr:hypothetical protein [Jejuia pallidilutea]
MPIQDVLLLQLEPLILQEDIIVRRAEVVLPQLTIHRLDIAQQDAVMFLEQMAPLM